MTKGPFGFNDNEPTEPTAEEIAATAAADAKHAERLEQIAKKLLQTYKRLAQWDRFTKANAGSPNEWEQVQKRRAKAYEDKLRLEREFNAVFEGDKNLPIVRPTLESTLEEIVAQIKRFFVIDETDAQILALWIVNSHVFLLQIFEHTPFLIVHSKDPGSGKSYLAEFIEELAANVRMTSSMTGSRLEAFLEKQAKRRANPDLVKYWNDNGLLGLGLNTLLFDEADRYENTGLLMRLLHAAHRKRGMFISKDGSDVRCFAPIAVFRLHDPRHHAELHAFVSRSILLEMKQADRNNPDHKREQWTEDNRRRLPFLNQQISFLVQENKANFKRWRPEGELLTGVSNRRADNWRPLIAIADVAEGHWGETIRRIASTPLTDPEPSTVAGSQPMSSEKERGKARIVAHLNGSGGRCRRTDLYADVFKYNLPSVHLSTYLTELEMEGRIRTYKEAPTRAGGRYTEMIELMRAASPAPAPAMIEPDLREEKSRCWFTPKEVMQAIHEVLGPAALDPASPPRPVWVRARRHYTEAKDGLSQSWRNDGWLFLNPPWEEIRKWLMKLYAEIANGNVRQAVVIIRNRRSNAYDGLIEGGAALINLGRLKFGNATSTCRDDAACFVLEFDNETVDALLAAFHRHGIHKAKVDRYGNKPAAAPV
jgi:hypothetical protein